MLKKIAHGVCMMAVIHPGLAVAHTQQQVLGTAAGATDFYEVTCSDAGLGPPAKLETSIKAGGTSASPRVSIQVVKGGAAVHSTDPVNGDTSGGPTLALFGGPGNYRVTIDKDGSGTQTYALEYHCRTSDGGHTPDDTDRRDIDISQ